MVQEVRELGFNCFGGDQTHALAAQPPDAHVRPSQNVLGRLAGITMARKNRNAAKRVIEQSPPAALDLPRLGSWTGPSSFAYSRQRDLREPRWRADRRAMRLDVCRV